MTSSNNPAGSSSPYRSAPPPPPASGEQVFDLRQDMGATKPKKKRKWGKRIALTLLSLILIGTIVGGGLFLFLYNRVTIPEPSEFALAQTTTVYYNDGVTEMGTFAEVNRTVVDASTLPAYVGNAIVASEDRTFYTNQGVDLKGIARAFVNNARGGARQGASTLSQQYIETYFGQATYGYKDKLREALMAIKINRTQSKETILSNYLNTIYFGRGAYGIEAASEVFFGVPAAKLSLSQAVMLSGIIPSPSNWDPAVNPEMAQKRFDRVLDLMVEDGWISQAEADQATFPETLPLSDGNTSLTGTTGYLMQQIRMELIGTGAFSDSEIDAGGLTIISTIDKEMQDAASRAREVMPADTPESVRLSLSSMDNRTGAILAEYAGPDYANAYQINGVTQEIAMAGSTFKPFSLIPFLEKGGSMEEIYNGNSPQTFENGTYEVGNSDGVSYGEVTVNEAVQHSINTVFVQVNEKAGPQATMDTLIKAGIPEDTPGLDPYLSNVLGSASVHNIDLTRAYATLANGGYKVNPHIVAEVKDPNGNTVHKAVQEWEPVFSSRIISMFLPAMKSVTEDGGTAAQVASLGLETAGKTGTSEEFRSAQFAGFIPQITTVVSMYNVGPDGSELPLPSIGGEEGFYGGKWPVDVWLNFMQQVSHKFARVGYEWFDASAVQKPLPPPVPTCSQNETLVDGACVPTPPTCAENETLVDGACVPTPPTGAENETLQGGVCVVIPPTCGPNEDLVNGACVPKPPVCGDGLILDENGQCVWPQSTG